MKRTRSAPDNRDIWLKWWCDFTNTTMEYWFAKMEADPPGEIPGLPPSIYGDIMKRGPKDDRSTVMFRIFQELYLTQAWKPKKPELVQLSLF